jgi:hypothetical protein
MDWASGGWTDDRLIDHDLTRAKPGHLEMDLPTVVVTLQFPRCRPASQSLAAGALDAALLPCAPSRALR